MCFYFFHIFLRDWKMCSSSCRNKIKKKEIKIETKGMKIKTYIPNLVFLKKYLFMEKKSEKLFNISLANDFPWLLFFFCCNVDIEF